MFNERFNQSMSQLKNHDQLVDKMKDKSDAQGLKIEFSKISYDRILTQNMKDYQDQNPGVNMHHAIDIIRPKAD